MVYIIAEKDGDYFKVGFTQNSIGARLNNLQVGNPRELVVWYVLSGGVREEVRIQRALRQWQVPGHPEWFSKQGADDIEQAIDGYTRLPLPDSVGARIGTPPAPRVLGVTTLPDGTCILDVVVGSSVGA